MPTKKPMPEVPVHFTMPADYRQRLVILRLKRGHKKIGPLVMRWIEEEEKRVAREEMRRAGI